MPIPRLVRRALCALACAALTSAAVGVSGADAATSISGCFGVNGTAITGLSTDVQYKTTAGGWRSMAGSVGRTNSYGCVRYAITGTARSWSLRIHAAGSVPVWRAMVEGETPTYGPAGSGSYNLGTSNMRWYQLPASAPTAPTSGGVDTSAWLDDMTDGNACRGNPSSAMLVACYMDRHGMHGNVVVLDYDHDGVEDRYDNYPSDPYRR